MATKRVPFEIKDNLVKFEDSNSGVYMYVEINLDTPSPRKQIESMFNNLLEATLDVNNLEA